MGGAGDWDRGLGTGPEGLVVFVLGSVFEDAGELHIVEVAFLVNGGLAVHLVHFLVREAVAHGGEQLPKVVLVDKTWGAAKARETRGLRLGHSHQPLPRAPARLAGLVAGRGAQEPTRPSPLVRLGSPGPQREEFCGGTVCKVSLWKIWGWGWGAGLVPLKKREAQSSATCIWMLIPLLPSCVTLGKFLTLFVCV